MLGSRIPAGLEPQYHPVRMAVRPVILIASALLLAGCTPDPDPASPDTSNEDTKVGEVAADSGADPEADATLGDVLDAPFMPGACGACPTKDGPIGGGSGYPRVVARATATLIVSSATELLNALSLAKPGNVIYVDDAATIDLTGKQNIVIPGGVTLASGRGVGGSPGGLIRTTTHASPPVFEVMGDDVRITGLRLFGPQEEVGDANYAATPASTGVLLTRRAGFELDNCEVYGWSWAGVTVASSKAHVHHSYFHHNRRYGLGYAIVLSGTASGLIESNLFDLNRHAIAGNGSRFCSYEARLNRVVNAAGQHAFDMHGEGEKVFDASSELFDSPYAGDRILIHHNTFLFTDERAVLIRGMPMTGAWIDHNSFAHDPDAAIKAVEQVLHFGNFYVSDNCQPRTSPVCP